MDAEPYGRLAALVERLIAETNLDISQIERLGGPDRSTLYLIRRGSTRRPLPATLQRLARALASHHLTGAVDMTRMFRYRRQLYEAVGYAQDEAADARQQLEEALLAYVPDATAVQIWLAFIVEHGGLSVPELLRAIERFAAAPRAERSIE